MAISLRTNIVETLHRLKRLLLPNLKLTHNSLWVSTRQHLIKTTRRDYLENVQGNKMFLDRVDSLELSWNRIYEPQETRFFQKHLKDGQVVLDIGANIGYYTLIFSSKVGPSGRVISFEPEPENFQILSRNVSVNGCKNVELVSKAVSDTAGKISLYLNTDNRGDHRIFDSSDGRSSVTVEAVRLDDFFVGFKEPIALVKMDIQGAELRALVGMTSLISRSPGVTLVTEFWPEALAACGSKPLHYLETLTGMGFRFFNFDEIGESLVPLRTADLAKMITIDPHVSTNLICTRRPSNLGIV